MLCRNIIFTKVPLLKAYRYRDVFQLVPFFYFKNMPFSKYAWHFPAVLEYEVRDVKEEIQPYEDELREKGLPIEVVNELVKNAILHRDYDIKGAPIYLEINDDAIIINSPGYAVPPI